MKLPLLTFFSYIVYVELLKLPLPFFKCWCFFICHLFKWWCFFICQCFSFHFLSLVWFWFHHNSLPLCYIWTNVMAIWCNWIVDLWWDWIANCLSLSLSVLTYAMTFKVPILKLMQFPLHLVHSTWATTCSWIKCAVKMEIRKIFLGIRSINFNLTVPYLILRSVGIDCGRMIYILLKKNF